MLNAQELHGYQDMSELEVNSELLVKDGLRSNTDQPGDQSLLTISGIMTMVLDLSVKTSDMVMVKEPEPETHTIDQTSTLELDIEDVLHQTLTSSNAESMVDQTKEIDLPKLTSNAGELHGREIHSKRLVVNSPLMVKLADTFGESTEVSGDQFHLTTSGTTTTVLKSFAET
jgi:hypothetical protein